ncbi:MAG: GAF domain-containing protein, partial [Gillisia sp.]
MKNQLQEFPLEIKISFHKVIEQYKARLEEEPSSIARQYIQEILEYTSSFPKLTEGLEDPADLQKFKDPIRILLNDLFPNILSNNEIKAASVPFHNLIFNSSRRLKNILANAGEEYELNMRNLDKDMFY